MASRSQMSAGHEGSEGSAAVCDRGCRSMDDCQTVCGKHPPWLTALDDAAFDALLGFANRVQKWSFGQYPHDPTYAEAAAHFAVPVEEINRAVVAHYWMFTPDTDRPLAERRIDHDGE